MTRPRPCPRPPRLLQVLTTKQMALTLLSTRPYALDPEQICKLLLEYGEGAAPRQEGGGGDRGHLLAGGA